MLIVKLTTLAGGTGPRPRLEPREDSEASEAVEVYKFLPETVAEESDRMQRMGMISSSRWSDAFRWSISGVGAAGVLAARVSFCRILERRDVALFAGVDSSRVMGWLGCGACWDFTAAFLISCSRCAPLLRNMSSSVVWILISSFGKPVPCSFVIVVRK